MTCPCCKSEWPWELPGVAAPQCPGCAMPLRFAAETHSTMRMIGTLAPALVEYERSFTPEQIHAGLTVPALRERDE